MTESFDIRVSKRRCPYHTLLLRCSHFKHPKWSIWGYAKCNYEHCPIKIKGDAKNIKFFNYSEDSHPEIDEFEINLDTYLEPDDKLSNNAIEYREELIFGVERMHQKVQEFKRKYFQEVFSK